MDPLSREALAHQTAMWCARASAAILLAGGDPLSVLQSIPPTLLYTLVANGLELVYKPRLEKREGSGVVS